VKERVNKKGFLTSLVVIILVLLISGCGALDFPNGEEDSEPVLEGRGIIKIEIDMDELRNILKVSRQKSVINTKNLRTENENFEPTHFGARLIVPEVDGVYMEKTELEGKGTNLLSLEIEATENAFLQAVVVHEPDGPYYEYRDFLLLVAKLDNILVESDSITSIKFEDLDLINPYEKFQFEMGWEERLIGVNDVSIFPEDEGVFFSWAGEWLNPFYPEQNLNRVSPSKYARIETHLGYYDEGLPRWTSLGRGSEDFNGERFLYWNLPNREPGDQEDFKFYIAIRGSAFALATTMYALPETPRQYGVPVPGDEDYEYVDKDYRWKFIWE